jgi:mono/diheme cytochrome c family protein
MANKIVIGALGVVGALAVGLGGAFLWGKSTVGAKLGTVYETHRADFPMPWPLSDAELDTLRQEHAAAAVPPDAAVPPGSATPPAVDPLAGLDLNAIATERAVARGKHLLEARYGCTDCHGADLGGGTMIDAPVLGSLLGSNLTSGKGSRTLAYTAADWDRAVRHGVKPDGTPTIMPSESFGGMSDQELSDLVMYIRAQPPVDAAVALPTWGPVGTMLVATGKMVPWAARYPDHMGAHATHPPATADIATFGAHLAQTCTGCHRANLSGGPMAAGDPSWPPASNLTSHEQGLKGWTLEQFTVTLREARRPDGTALKPPMSDIAPYAAKMTDAELQALFAYLQSLPPMPTGS